MFKRFLKDQSGQFAILFSLAATMLVAGVGVAIDVSSIQSEKQKYQDLSDAAVLAAAVSGKQTQAELQLIAENTVHSVPGNEDFNVDLRILPENAIQVVVSKPHELWLLSAFTADFEISATSEAPPRGDVKMNVALVLDITESMDGAKLDSLKTAANNLVDQFRDDDNGPGTGGGVGDDGLDGDDGDSSVATVIGIDDGSGTGTGDGTGDGGFDENFVKFSVVPFARYVKIPKELESESWLFVEPPHEACWDRLDIDASQAAGVCTLSPEEGVKWNCESPVYFEHCEVIEWDGCVTSRIFPWNTRPYVGPHEIPGFAGGGGCASELLPLTADLDNVSEAIDNLYTFDETYIPSGLIWGWRTLTPEAPLVEASLDTDAERKDVMILMTDGENSRSYGGEKDNGFFGVFHWRNNPENANILTAELCEDIKADGIEMYTIAFEVESAETQSMLRTCASSPDKYFDATDAVQLLAVFNSIGVELAAVRLSK